MSSSGLENSLQQVRFYVFFPILFWLLKSIVILFHLSQLWITSIASQPSVPPWNTRQSINPAVAPLPFAPQPSAPAPTSDIVRARFEQLLKEQATLLSREFSISVLSEDEVTRLAFAKIKTVKYFLDDTKPLVNLDEGTLYVTCKPFC